MKHIISMCLFAFLFAPLGLAKGLKDMKPEPALELIKDAKTKVKEKLPKNKGKAKEKPPSPTVTKKQFIEGNAEVIVDTNIAYTTIKGSTGDWGSGFSGDFRVGYRIFQMLEDKLQIYATYHYLPTDVIVTEKQTQYSGIVEQHLFGTSLRYILKQDIHLIGLGELGLASSKLKASTAIVESSDLEDTGVGLVIGGGAQWRIAKKIWIGGYLNLGAGSFQTSQLGFSTSITL